MTTRYPLDPLAAALGIELLASGWQDGDTDPLIPPRAPRHRRCLRGVDPHRRTLER